MPSSFSTSTSILSPAPISPFSPRTLSSSASHYTSDDLPDLGAFTTVLREWVHLQPYPRIPSHHHVNYQQLHSHFEPDLEDRTEEASDRDTSGARSTVWNQRPIADYLHSSLSQITRSTSLESESEATSSQSSDLDEDEEEDEIEDDEEENGPENEQGNEEDEEDTEGARTVEIADDDDEEDERDHDDTHLASVGSTPLRTQPSPHSPIEEDDRDLGHEVPISVHVLNDDLDIDIDDADTDAFPSLGYLDEALSFIAAERERARWSAFYGTGAGTGGVSLGVREEGEWMHVIEPPTRRKKRRGRKRPLPVTVSLSGEQLSIATGRDNYLNYPRTEGEDDEIKRDEEDELSPPKSISKLKSRSKSTPPTSTPQLLRPKAHPPNYVYAQGYDSPITNTTTITTTAVDPVSPSISTSSKATLIPKPKSKSTSASVSTPTLTSASTSKPKPKSKSTSKSTSTYPPLPQPPQPKPKLKIKTHDDNDNVQLPLPTVRGIINLPYKILAHSRSTPTLRSPSPRITNDANYKAKAKTRAASPSAGVEVGVGLHTGNPIQTHALGEISPPTQAHAHPHGERPRLLQLARVLRGVFPEDGARLGEVERRLKVGLRLGEGLGGREDVLDVRGRDPVPSRGGAGGDPLIHVFVDHSNILFGLLTYLKRHPSLGKSKEKEKEGTTLKPKPPKPRPPGGADEDGVEDEDAMIPISSPTRTETGKGKGLKQSTLTTAVKGGLLVLGKTAARTRPLPPIPIPGSAAGSQTQSVPVPASPKQVQAHTGIGLGGATPIPLPSFATAGRALKRGGGGGGGVVSPSQSQHQDSQFVNDNSNGELGHAKPTSPSSPSKSISKSKGNHLSRSKPLGVGSMDAAVRSISGSGSIYGNNNNRFLLSGDARGGDDDDEDGHEGEDEGEVNKMKIRIGRSGVGDDGVRERERGDRNGSRDGGGDGDGGGVGDGGEDEDEGEEGEPKTKKRQPRRLSHNALALILERGRPITRRVLVTSSPLYQPMDTMERLGYEVRVYMRVPDLGDGMDRERHHHKRKDSTGTGSGSGGSPKRPRTHARRISGSTSAESAGATSASASASVSASTSAGEAAKGSGRNHFVPRPSFPFPEGSSSSNMLAPPVSIYPHPLARAVDYNLPTPSPGGLGRRIRYREQGVDELLQLKLHQALAATDDVPEGATIVLATGDGNVGQFSEDGFLGPVRTALRRGWKVELYAWEEGLSRAWRREFGEGSEWGRSGMFHIVGMEQFAESLVEGGL